MRGVARTGLVFAIVTASCGEPAAPVRAVPDPPAPIPKDGVHRLVLEPASTGDLQLLFVGGDLAFRVSAYDARGVNLPSADTKVDISDPFAANLDLVAILGIDGKPRDLRIGLEFMREGTLTLIARLGAAADTLTLVVGPPPPPSTTIQVDSFAIIEHRYDCPNGCHYIVYSPVLRLSHHGTGGQTNLVWARIALADLRSTRCPMGGWMSPGESREYGGFDPYLWNNTLLFVAVDDPITADVARLELLVRTQAGRYEMVEATGPLLPLASGATLPGPSALDWGC